MRIEFDPDKDASNIAKHGVSLALVSRLDWAAALVWSDARRAYGEVRLCALAPLDGRLYFVAFVERSDVRRPISVRKANSREVQRYAQDDHD